MGSQVPGTEAAHSLDGGIRVGGGGVLFICCWQNPGSKLERRKRQTPVEKESWPGATKVKDHTHPGGGRGSGAKSGKIGIGSQGKETTGQANALTMFGQLV